MLVFNRIGKKTEDILRNLLTFEKSGSRPKTHRGL